MTCRPICVRHQAGLGCKQNENANLKSNTFSIFNVIYILYRLILCCNFFQYQLPFFSVMTIWGMLPEKNYKGNSSSLILLFSSWKTLFHKHRCFQMMKKMQGEIWKFWDPLFKMHCLTILGLLFIFG